MGSRLEGLKMASLEDKGDTGDLGDSASEASLGDGGGAIMIIPISKQFSDLAVCAAGFADEPMSPGG